MVEISTAFPGALLLDSGPGVADGCLDLQRLAGWSTGEEEVGGLSVKQGGPGGHSASKRAHFRHFQSVLETVFFVFSVNLIHILILF